MLKVLFMPDPDEMRDLTHEEFEIFKQLSRVLLSCHVRPDQISKILLMLIKVFVQNPERN